MTGYHTFSQSQKPLPHSLTLAAVRVRIGLLYLINLAASIDVQGLCDSAYACQHNPRGMFRNLRKAIDQG